MASYLLMLYLVLRIIQQFEYRAIQILYVIAQEKVW